MKIKIGNKIYSGKDQPIMVILTKQDKQNIENMLPNATKYCEFPDNMQEEEIRDWMKVN